MVKPHEARKDKLKSGNLTTTVVQCLWDEMLIDSISLL